MFFPPFMIYAIIGIVKKQVHICVGKREVVLCEVGLNPLKCFFYVPLFIYGKFRAIDFQNSHPILGRPDP